MLKFGGPRSEIGPHFLPKGLRIYVVGDVHGRADLLDLVMRRIDADLGRYPILKHVHIFLGDYIDRGPASSEVIQLLIARSRSHEMVFLKGNHDGYVNAFLRNPAVLADWRRYGGLETLMSYGIKVSSNNPEPKEQIELAGEFDRVLPKQHRNWLSRLRLSVIYGDYFFVHAGVRPGIPLYKQREEDLLWIRDEFLLCKENYEKLVVHGHTPVSTPDFRPNRINIDTGAYASGRLACLVLEGQKRRLI